MVGRVRLSGFIEGYMYISDTGTSTKGSLGAVQVVPMATAVALYTGTVAATLVVARMETIAPVNFILQSVMVVGRWRRFGFDCDVLREWLLFKEENLLAFIPSLTALCTRQK